MGEQFLSYEGYVFQFFKNKDFTSHGFKLLLELHGKQRMEALYRKWKSNPIPDAPKLNISPVVTEAIELFSQYGDLKITNTYPDGSIDTRTIRHTMNE